MKHKPVVLVILDGWGVAPASDGNGISEALVPNFDRLVDSYPALTLLASGEAVGLSWGEMGNSEVGHMNLGVGRIFYQNLPRIDKAIQDGSFFKNKVFLDACEHVKKNKSKLHLMGLMSEGKVHGMNSHCYALLELAKRNKVEDVFVHAFLDGRDSTFNSGIGFVAELEKKMKEIGIGKLASLHGRFYAMDRDNHWEREEKSYFALVNGQSEEYFSKAAKAIESSYEKKVYDEEFVPVVLGKAGAPVATIGDNDAVIFFNYRADRARQLTRAFVMPDFDKFERGPQLQNLYFGTMMEYEDGLPVKVAFPREVVKTSLSKVLSDKGFKQLHVAETEKYAHVTFFFSGGVEEPYEGEDRIVIPSPRVASYVEAPEMSAGKITKTLQRELAKEKYDFVVVNYANADMVGHSGNKKATIKAVEFVDKCLGEIVNLVLSKDGYVIVTADHGNAEELVNLQTAEIDKEHSTNPVPCVIVGREFEGKTAKEVQSVGNDLSLVHPTGLLFDVTATVLKLLKVNIPPEMTGKPLV